jgi:hypothetical protein
MPRFSPTESARSKPLRKTAGPAQSEPEVHLLSRDEDAVAVEIARAIVEVVPAVVRRLGESSRCGHLDVLPV